MHCSNTFNLVVNKSWSGVFIEANKKKFLDLKKTYEAFKRAVLINEFVNISGENTLDRLLTARGLAD